MTLREETAAVVGAVALAGAGPAEACRYGGNQRVLLEAEPPPFAQATDLVLRVRIISVDGSHARAEAEVLEPIQGRLTDRSVRVAVRSTAACGPAATPGAEGVLTAQPRRTSEGLVLVPRTRTYDGRRVDGP